jgi:hypothetical protein
VTFPQTISPGQANPETPIQEDFRALQGASVYGRRDEAISGLTFAWHGDPSVPVADGTQLLGASTTTYMVVHRTTRAASFATSTTNWNDGTIYGRAWRLVTSGSGITTFEDWRFRELGILAGGSGGGTVDAEDIAITDSGSYYTDTDVEGALQEIGASFAGLGLSGFRYAIELANTTASDPGAGLLKFNNAALVSVTALYIDDSTVDGVDLSTFFASLGTSGFVRLTSASDVTEWRVFKWTAALTDNTSWWTLTVIDQAGTGTFEDADEVQVLFLQLSASGAGLAGSTGSTDNALLRADGTGGSTVQSTGILVTDDNEISGYRGHVNRQTGTTYTLDTADNGKVVELANASAITLTLPNSFPKGWHCTVVQDAAGAVTFTAASGATLKQRQSHTKTAGDGAICVLYVSSNAGSAAAYRLGGDTAT